MIQKIAGALLAVILCYSTQGAQIPCNTSGVRWSICYVHGKEALCQRPWPPLK